MATKPGQLRKSLESRGGGGGVATSRKRGVPRSILVPSLKPWLLLNEATDYLEGGLNVGDYWPFHEGGYRLCQAKEALSPGRVTFWAGPEEGRTSAVNGTKTILPVKSGQRNIFVETTVSFEEGEFQEGLLRISGGLSTVAGRYFVIAYNKESYASADISGDANRYVTELVLADPIDVALNQDTDWHIQGNLFACQRHAPGDVSSDDDHTDQPRFSVGIPRIPVAENDYFWCQTRGAAQGQLLGAINSADCVSGKIDLMPYIGTNDDSAIEKSKLGKLVPVDASSDIPSQVFARLIVRKETTFAANAFVPIWLYGSTDV